MGSLTQTREELTELNKILTFFCWKFEFFMIFMQSITKNPSILGFHEILSPFCHNFQSKEALKCKPFQRNIIFHIDFQIRAACLNWYRRYTPQKVNLKARVLQIALHNEIVKLKGKRNYQFLGGNDWIFIVIHSFLGFIWKFQCKIKSFPKCKQSTLAFYALSKRFFSVFRICVNGNNANWWKFLNL